MEYYFNNELKDNTSVITDKKQYLSTDYSLELSLMLVFIYLAARKVYPVLQRDILEGAQTDSYGYLTAYKQVC